MPLPSRVVLHLTDALHKAALMRYIKTGQFKTEGAYQRQVWRAIRDLYKGESDEFQFIDDMVTSITNQYSRAWREGARDMGVDPRKFSDADLAELDRLITAEQEFILGLAEDITKARESGGSIDPFRVRSEMWAGRYPDVVNQAHIWFGKGQRLKWVWSPEKEHCEDCARLNGIVATAEDWAASGWRPGSVDLACHGFFCGCELVPTDEPATEGGIPSK